MHVLPGGECVEWSDIRVFLAIVRGGSLGAAARSVGSTQPTMGRRLRALEQAIGSTLFQRTEPPRESWRLQLLREWSHEQVEQVFP